MIRFIVATAFVFLMLVSLLRGNPPAPESGVPPAQSIAEVRFSDGSIVRMTLLQESIEIKTKYGALTIPVSEIRRVEIGLHIDAEMNVQIAKAIKLLASDVYKERDNAAKALLQCGRFALPALHKAALSSDQEVSRRANFLLTQFAARLPPELFKLREEDVIHTSEFLVVGKIHSPTLKAKSPHFGDLTLKLSELRLMLVRQPGTKASFIVDAAKHGSSLDQWRDTGILIDVSQTMRITSDGQVDLWPQGPGQYTAFPKGYNTTGKGGQFMAGALIGRIGGNGKSFYIGEKFEGTALEEGTLYFQIVPSPWSNASTGEYKVLVQTDIAAISR